MYIVVLIMHIHTYVVIIAIMQIVIIVILIVLIIAIINLSLLSHSPNVLCSSLSYNEIESLDNLLFEGPYYLKIL